tara:strand:+ start:248 stop:421 length:174 start_codon:yes stop_codon:yes gene_type:complete
MLPIKTNELITLFNLIEDKKRKLSLIVNVQSNREFLTLGEIQDTIKDLLADRINENG